MTTKKEQEDNLINLRKSKVSELLSKGHTNQSENSKILNISEATVSRDLAYLRQQAQDNLKTQIQSTIPFEYQKSMEGLKQVLQMVWDIALNATKTSEKLEACALINNCY